MKCKQSSPCSTGVLWIHSLKEEGPSDEFRRVLLTREKKGCDTQYLFEKQKRHRSILFLPSSYKCMILWDCYVGELCVLGHRRPRFEDVSRHLGAKRGWVRKLKAKSVICISRIKEQSAVCRPRSFFRENTWAGFWLRPLLNPEDVVLEYEPMVLNLYLRGLKVVG